MSRHRLGYAAAAIALCVVPLTGCDAAQEKLSTAEACGELVEMSLSELKKAQENLGNQQEVAKSLRSTAQRFQDKAAEVEDADLKKAIDTYTTRMRKLARQAKASGTPNLDAMVKANSDLAAACA